MEDALVRNDVVGLVELMKLAIAGTVAGEDPTQVGKTSLETLKVVLQSSLNTVNAQITNMNKLSVISLATASGNTLLEIDNVQCFEPRGRFNLKVTSTSILLEGKQFSVLVPIQNVQQVLCLPSFTSAKKEGEDYLALTLEEPVKINTKESTNILLNLSRVTNPSTRSPMGDCDLNEADVVMMAIQDATGVHITRPQGTLFSTLRDQKPYLKCYRGTQEGAIYPMPSGIVFVKPLLFISADEIASIGAGRGGGSGNTRYVDLNIETADEKTYEFTNIDREELPALQMYIKGYLEVRAAKQQARAQKEAKLALKAGKASVIDLDEEHDEARYEGEDGGDEEDDEDSDDSDEDDDDYDPDASDSDAPKHKRRRDRSGGEGDGSGAEDSDDSDDSDNSDVSDDSDNSDADSDAEQVSCSAKKSNKSKNSSTATKASKASKAADAGSPSPKKAAKQAARKKSPVKKAVKSAQSPVKKATAVPGMPIKREVPLPGQPIVKSEGAVVDLFSDEKGDASGAGAKAREGRKTSAPVKRAPKEPKEAKESKTKAGQSRVTVTSMAPGSAVVKREPPVPGSSVIRLDDPEMQEVFVKPEPKVVVDLTPSSSKVETLDPAVAAARAFNAAKAAANASASASASAEEEIPTGSKAGLTSGGSSSGGVSSAPAVVAPVLGAKRTIMDMFAAQKKVVKTEDIVSEVVKID